MRVEKGFIFSKSASSDTLTPLRPHPFKALQPPQIVPTGQQLPTPEPVRGSFHSNYHSH